MLELKASEAWYSPTSYIVPTKDLTATERRRLDEREALIDAALAELKKPETFVKLNSSIHKGSIIRIPTKQNARWDLHCDIYDANEQATRGHWSLAQFAHGRDPARGWKWADRYLQFSTYAGRKPVQIGQNTIYCDFLGGEHNKTTSWLIGYEGEEVFCLDEKKRPPTFTDRLDQTVEVGDLVVVALNYGAGLDVCVIKGFADERRVIIEAMDSGELDRIPLEKDNSTSKIMKMPNSLRDTALMMKLSRS